MQNYHHDKIGWVTLLDIDCQQLKQNGCWILGHKLFKVAEYKLNSEHFFETKLSINNWFKAKALQSKGESVIKLKAQRVKTYHFTQ